MLLGFALARGLSVRPDHVDHRDKPGDDGLSPPRSSPVPIVRAPLQLSHALKKSDDRRDLSFRFAAQADRIIEMVRRQADSEMAPQPLETPQNELANGAGLAHSFAVAAGSGAVCSRTMSRSAISRVSSASRSPSVIRPRVEAIQRR
jgi:hypothetical protein